MPIEIKLESELKLLSEIFGKSTNEILSLLSNSTIGGNQTVRNESTVLEVIDSFMKHIKNHPKRSDSSKKTYLNFLIRLRNFIEETDRNMKVVQLNENVLHEFLRICEPRKNDKLAPRTINKYTAILRKLLYFAFTHELAYKDYRGRFEWTNDEKLPRYLQDHEVLLVLEKALHKTRAIQCHAILSFLFGTGCRISEIVNVRVKDFNMDTGLLYVIGKGDKERYIPIFPNVKQIILDYLNHTGVTVWNENISGFLFARDYGIARIKPISVRSIQSMFQTIMSELNWENRFTIHSCRHTFAVNCLKAGMSITYLSQILGHKDLATTSIYTQLFPKDLQKEIQEKYPFAFEQLLFRLMGVESVNGEIEY